MTATCACGQQLGRANRSGKCRICHNRYVNSDPEIRARREARMAEYWSTPEAKKAGAEHMRRIMAALSPEEIERRRENGRRLARDVLSREDVRAKSASPEVRARAGAARTDTTLAWCPPDLRDEYRGLVRKGLTASEARAAVEPMIPGTVAHARRAIANIQLRTRLREERRQAEAY